MKTNDILRNQIFDIISIQMKANDPPETSLTYKRLIDQGYTDFKTKQLIGQCLALELFGVFKHKKPFDEVRYVKNLKQLPKEPNE